MAIRLVVRSGGGGVDGSGVLDDATLVLWISSAAFENDGGRFDMLSLRKTPVKDELKDESLSRAAAGALVPKG